MSKLSEMLDALIQENRVKAEAIRMDADMLDRQRNVLQAAKIAALEKENKNVE